MKAVTRDQFIELLKTRGSATLLKRLEYLDLTTIVTEGPACVVQEGDLTLNGDWEPPLDGNVLVLGSIHCPGTLDTAPKDAEDSGASLWVLGDVHCQNFVAHHGTPCLIDGSLKVDGLAFNACTDNMLLVSKDFSAYFFFGLDIRAEVGGKVEMEYGEGYAMPLYFGVEAGQRAVTEPRHGAEASFKVLNLTEDEIEAEEVDPDELLANLRRGKHFRARGGRR